MIGLLIQDNAYEQDIRELLMSFYPGESYAHEVKENIDFYVPVSYTHLDVYKRQLQYPWMLQKQ